MINNYLKSSRFGRSIPDWIAVLILLFIFFFIVEPAKPFQRQFKLSDHTLQHPFASSERITDNELYLLSCVLPLIVITLVCNTTKIRNVEYVHIMQISILGLFVALSITGVITDILKNWIGRPRPDFLARCGAASTTPIDTYVGVEVCTAPLGQMYLLDGGKSTPSGHASLSFSGLFYLYLWVIGYFKLGRESKLWKHIIAFVPIIIAMYIGLSRTQDYRHHFFDIIFGSGIGISVASSIYFRYFPGMDFEESNKLNFSDDVLPV